MSLAHSHQRPLPVADERQAVQKWLADHDTSPLTGQRLEHKQLIPNVLVRRQLREFRETHPGVGPTPPLRRCAMRWRVACSRGAHGVARCLRDSSRLMWLTGALTYGLSAIRSVWRAGKRGVLWCVARWGGKPVKRTGAALAGAELRRLRERRGRASGRQ